MGDLSTATVATRDRIIDAAMELFSEHGYRDTSITRIEQAAGLSPGADGIYHHFPSKEALLTAGVQRQLSRLADAVAQVVEETYREFAEWIIDRSGSVASAHQADAIATIGLGALISARLLPTLLGTTHSRVDDDVIVETWVRALEHLLATKPNVSA